MGLMSHDLHREYLRQMRTGEVRKWEDVPTDEEYALLCAGTVREDAGDEFTLDSTASSASSYGRTARESAERVAEVESREVGR